MSHDDLRELSGVYALGALEGQDRVRFESHLASCAECAAEVRALRAVGHGLAPIVEQQDPPPALRDRVMARAGASAAEDAVPRRGPAMPRWLAAAAALAAVSIGLYAATLRVRIQTLEIELSDLRTRAVALERDLERVRREADTARGAAFVLAAHDVLRIDLAGQPPAPSATGRVFWSPSRGLVFSAADLPAVPPGRVYQLWVLRGPTDPPVSAGLVHSEPSGTGILSTGPLTIPGATGLAVSLEPEGGVPAPTGDIYLVGRI
jgi:anti-sigma-K factor RskA